MGSTITHIWVQVYDYRYMITGIWLQVWLQTYDCRHMISNIWYDDRHMIEDIWYPYMVKLKDPMSADIWSYTAVYGFHVYDSGARIWDTYMCMQTYDTHICVSIPLRWNAAARGDIKPDFQVQRHAGCPHVPQGSSPRFGHCTSPSHIWHLIPTWQK